MPPLRKKLERLADTLPKHDMQLILADFNAKFGKKERTVEISNHNGRLRNVTQSAHKV